MRLLKLLPLVLLAACGQSGDLYLPAEQPKPAEQQPAPPAEAPPAEKPADKKDAPKEAR